MNEIIGKQVVIMNDSGAGMRHGVVTGFFYQEDAPDVPGRYIVGVEVGGSDPHTAWCASFTLTSEDEVANKILSDMNRIMEYDVS